MDKEYKIWHEPNEKPSKNCEVMAWIGDELVQCHYRNGKFIEKTATEEHGTEYTVGNLFNGFGRLFVSRKSRADLTDLVIKWAELDALLNIEETDDVMHCTLDWYDGFYLDYTQEEIAEIVLNQKLEVGNKLNVKITKQ